MKTLLACAVLLLTGAPDSGAPDAQIPEAAGDARSAGDAPPYRDSFARGMAEVMRLAEEKRNAEAIELTDALLGQTGYGRLRAALERGTGGWSAPG